MLLINGQGKVVGHSTSWIVGGPKSKTTLAPGATSVYDFVVEADKPFTKTQLIVERIVLENDKLGNPLKDVVVTDSVPWFIDIRKPLLSGLSCGQNLGVS
jgi:hypothetical protein